MSNKLKKIIAAIIIILSGGIVAETTGTTDIFGSYGAPTDFNTFTTVIATSTSGDPNPAGLKVLSVNPSRQYFKICNNTAVSALTLVAATSSNEITAVPGEGIVLNTNANGTECWEMDSDSIYTGEIRATSTIGAATINISIIER